MSKTITEENRPDWNIKDYPISKLVKFKGKKKISDHQLTIDNYENAGYLTKKPIPWFVMSYWNR